MDLAGGEGSGQGGGLGVISPFAGPSCGAVGMACGVGFGQGHPMGKTAIEEKKIMTRFALPALLALGLVAGCVGVTGSRTVVERAGPDELLKLRAGPGLGFRVIVGLPDGTEVIRRDCVTELGQLWCRVALVEAPMLTGYVSADYLAER